MTKEEAAAFLMSISWKLGNAGIEYLSEKDGDKMREAIEVLEQQPDKDSINKTEVINTIHKTIYGFFDIVDDDSEESINDKDKLLLTVNKAISKAVEDLHLVTLGSKMIKVDILDKIVEEIENAKKRQLEIAFGINDANERRLHIYIEEAYTYCIDVINKYRKENEE